MIESKILKFSLFLLAVAFLISLVYYARSYSEDFKLSTDALDEFGGQASSANFSKRIGSGGQASVIGMSGSANFDGLQGYVHTAAYVHGDVNADGIVDMSDVVYLQNYVLQSGDPPIPLETGDVNCSKTADIADVVYLYKYVLMSGPPPCNL